MTPSMHSKAVTVALPDACLHVACSPVEFCRKDVSGYRRIRYIGGGYVSGYLSGYRRIGIWRKMKLTLGHVPIRLGLGLDMRSLGIEHGSVRFWQNTWLARPRRMTPKPVRFRVRVGGF